MSLLCLLVGHKFEVFRITQWGIPYNTGRMEYYQHCYRCGQEKKS